MITSLKITYERFPTKLLTYRSYEYAWNYSIINKFELEAQAIQSGDIGSLKSVITKKSLNTVALLKKGIVCGNNKLDITSLIRKEITARSMLKNKKK